MFLDFNRRRSGEGRGGGGGGDGGRLEMRGVVEIRGRSRVEAPSMMRRGSAMITFATLLALSTVRKGCEKRTSLTYSETQIKVFLIISWQTEMQNQFIM